jgi:hypothetical protein
MEEPRQSNETRSSETQESEQIQFVTIREKLKKHKYYSNKLETVNERLNSDITNRQARNLKRIKENLVFKLQTLDIKPRFIYIRTCITKAPSNRPLAHCIGEDARMSAGAALSLKRKFPGIVPPKGTTTVGKCTITTIGKRSFINIVTKPQSKGKPRYQDFKIAIRHFMQVCRSHDWRSISITKLGAGLDKFSWDSQVKPLLQYMFNQYPVDFYVHTN